MMRVQDVALLACPDCRGPLVWHGQSEDDRLDEGRLLCGRCGETWEVADGLARLYREDRVQGTDRLMRHIYDGLPALHDPLTTMLTPLFQSVSESRMRDGYMRRLELGALKARDDGQPVRVLEVGVGAGANLPRIRGALPPGLPVEVWGLDLSTGMLEQCEKRLRKGRGVKDTRLLVADAHALPFRDDTFDRVFHVGGIGSYRQPAVALREMARVARPGTPLVVVDEQLDADFRPSLFQRAAFRALTFYTREAKSPRALLPQDAEGVIEEQVSPFYYCLTFRVPAAVTG